MALKVADLNPLNSLNKLTMNFDNFCRLKGANFGIAISQSDLKALEIGNYEPESPKMRGINFAINLLLNR
jgi:hypothetical protein